MSKIVAPVVFSLIACGLVARPGMAQTEDAAARTVETAAGGGPATSGPTPAVAAPASTERGRASSFVHDVGGDYVHFFSKENAVWLGAGGLAALAVHPADDNLSEWAQEHDTSMPGGYTYGSQLLHIPVAIVVWAAGAASGSHRVADTGRDLLRAQIAVGSWTYAIKVASDRTRPNGGSYSFPSGHSSTSFATAMVLEEHFGWKLGVPAFAVAAYTAGSRVVANDHWASDVIFGAALGMASGRTVTIQLREARVSVAPLAAPGGGGALVTAVW